MSLTRARPHIMLQCGVAEDAIALWTRAFPELVAQPPRSVAQLWELALGDQYFTLFDSPEPHEFAPTPAWSFMIDLAEVTAVDAALAILSSQGGTVVMPADTYPFATRFAWVEDRFKISWQLRHGAAA